jgi:toxin FitB
VILIDSNIIIYAASGKYPDVTAWLAEQNMAVSAIVVLEVLGYHQLKPAEKAELENLFSKLVIFYPHHEIFQLAINLRQIRKISIGDALIAATSIHEEIPLATHNVSDFSWIEGLRIIDPLE